MFFLVGNTGESSEAPVRRNGGRGQPRESTETEGSAGNRGPYGSQRGAQSREHQSQEQAQVKFLPLPLFLFELSVGYQSKVSRQVLFTKDFLSPFLHVLDVRSARGNVHQ